MGDVIDFAAAKARLRPRRPTIPAHMGMDPALECSLARMVDDEIRAANRRLWDQLSSALWWDSAPIHLGGEPPQDANRRFWTDHFNRVYGTRAWYFDDIVPPPNDPADAS